MIVVPETTEQNIILLSFACEILGETYEHFGFDRNGKPLFMTMGFVRGDDLICVVVAHGYMKPNIVFSFASTDPRWATRTNLKALGDWAFDRLGCERITSLVKKNNKRSRKFVEGVGFKYEGKLRKACDDTDIIIYGLLKDEHKQWLRKAFNGWRQRINHSTTR